jgi:hypothetical protein
VLVQQAESPPFGDLLTGGIDGPFVDCGLLAHQFPGLDPVRCYLAETTAFQIGQSIGMVSREEHEKQGEALACARARIDELEQELREADKLTEGTVAFMKAGYLPRKQTGRPKAKKEPAHG